MKTWLRLLSLLAVFGSLALTAQTARADLVYDNSTNDLLIRFNPGTNEVGDEIILAPGARIVTNFIFQYWGLNFSGTEKVEVRFYANNGTNSLSGWPVPGTLLYDSGPFSIGATPRNTLVFDLNSLTVGVPVPLTGPVPTDFTWSVQFSGLGPLASAGVDQYGTTSNSFGAGWSYPDVWVNTGNGYWELRTNTVPINFAAQIYAIPEPTVVVFGLLGGLALLALKLRNNRR
jgi:hypothetical protein